MAEGVTTITFKGIEFQGAQDFRKITTRRAEIHHELHGINLLEEINAGDKPTIFHEEVGDDLFWFILLPDAVKILTLYTHRRYRRATMTLIPLVLLEGEQEDLRLVRINRLEATYKVQNSGKESFVRVDLG